VSGWETEGVGPAKRVYPLTGEGLNVPGFWIRCMKDQTDKLLRFVGLYPQSVEKKEPSLK
jgi:hypothetical protein